MARVGDEDEDEDLGRAATISGEHRIGPAAEMPTLAANERYQMLEVLGRGGMGEVRKAYDPQLGRYVALKIMRDASPELARRLVQEARAQARVEHENICKVYGVGELDGQPFIALQYIEGGATLRDLAPRMTREERIAVLRDVAFALHAAHRHGLIHRDVKPSNVLVERTDSGWKPYVADFGIARAIDAPGLTKTGVAQGTPLYMAPEQARGETQKLDRRTDVYGLGATLFELLAGRPPFTGDSSVSVIMRVVTEDPPAARTIDPSIPVDVETIITKCLEKNPARRYETARALAEDLQRYLDGEPIQARRGSLAYRLAKRARKHRAIVIAASTLFVVALTLGGFAWQARRNAARLTRLAQKFEQEVERNDALVRYAALLPLHDTRRELEIIRGRMREIEAQMRALGSIAEGPGHYALGRGYLALEQLDDAERELSRAWAAGYQTPEVSYALGQVLGALYQRGLQEAARSEDQVLTAARKRELQARYRDPALRYLKQLGELHVEAPEYVEGLIAYYDERYGEALGKATEAAARVPWLYEAHTLVGDIHLTLGLEREVAGDVDEALAEFSRAGDGYRAAAELAKSSASARAGDCRRWLETGQVQVDRDESPNDSVKNALAACDAALVARPDDAARLADEAEAWRVLARWQGGHARDPDPALAAALALTERAVAAAPKRREAHCVMGRVYLSMADRLLERSRDPRPVLDRALASAQAALELDPRAFETFTLLCDAYSTRGDWESAHGVDPRASYDRAIDYGKRAVELAPGGLKSNNAIAIALLSKGTWELGAGIDPTVSLTHAAEIFSQLVARSPHVDFGYSNLCGTDETLAEYEVERGVDPRPRVAEAVHACEQALEVNPNYAGSHFNLGCAHVDAALWLFERGEDPGAELTAAREALARALAVDEKYAIAWRWRGDVELLAARQAEKRGQSPEASFAQAASALEKALELTPNDAEVLRTQAELARRRAEWRLEKKLPAAAELKRGLELAARALAENPRSGATLIIEGALELLAARAGRDRAAADRARAALDRALSLDKNRAREIAPLLAEAGKWSALP